MEVKLLFIVRDLYTRRPIRARLTLNNTRDDRDTDQILHVLDRTQNDRRLLLTGNRDLFYVLVPPVNPVDVVTWATKVFYIYILVKSKFFKVCQKECVNYGLQKKIFAPNWRKWFYQIKVLSFIFKFGEKPTSRYRPSMKIPVMCGIPDLRTLMEDPSILAVKSCLVFLSFQ